MKILTLFCLTLALFPHCFGLEDSCACGVACEDDQGTADCITENTFRIIDKIRDFNKEVCVEYKVRYKKRLDIYLCKFPRKFEPEDYCDTANDGTLVCNIQSPNFNEDQCYPEQTFCAHSVNCPPDTLLLFHHSEMKLTANNNNVGTSPSECTDFVTVDETTSIIHTRCGNEKVNDFISPHPLVVTSSSSQCCQSYGYFMWANCVPTVSQSGKRDVSTEKQPYLILQNEKFYKEWEITAKLGFLHVDSESVVKCGKYMVSVVKRDEIIAEFTNIEVIMVYAEITDHETYLDLSTQAGTFVGKGILYIGKGMAKFLQQGIPEEIYSNEEEKAYIQRNLDFLVPFFIRQNSPQIQGFPEDFTEWRVEEIYNPLLMDFEFNSTSPFPLIEFPTLLEQNQALAKAGKYSRSANPFVRSTANLVIQTLSTSKTDET